MPPRGLPTVVEIKGRQLIIWEDIDNKFIRACLAEFMAMHLFVLLCCGCAMVTLNLDNPNLMMVAASFGFGILCLAQIFGPLSGGHINSAVSLGLFVAGRTSLIKTICYTLSQMLGSVFGALFLWAIFGSNWPAARAFGSNSFDESVFTGGQVFFAEMLGTMLLMFNVLSTIDIPQEGGGPLGVYPIAMSVMVAHLFLIPIDGCSINPTRSFGPSLVAQWAKIEGNYDHQQAVFWFGPMFGACVAAFFYEYGTLKPENFAGAKDMDTAIFQAGKTKRKIKKRPSHANPDAVHDVENDLDTINLNSTKKPFESSHPRLSPDTHFDYTSASAGASHNSGYYSKSVNVTSAHKSGEFEMTSNPMMSSNRASSPPTVAPTSTSATTGGSNNSSDSKGSSSSVGGGSVASKGAVYHNKDYKTGDASSIASAPAAPKTAPPATLPNIPSVPTKPAKGNKKDKQEKQQDTHTAAPTRGGPSVATGSLSNVGFEEFTEEDLI